MPMARRHAPDATSLRWRHGPTPETYEVLRLAGFYVDGLEDRDNRSALWRWLSRLGEIKPPFVDLGGRPLTHAQTADR